MRLTNKTYDILKWVCLIALPALCVFYKALNLPYAEQVCQLITALDALLGAMIGVSCYQYNKEETNEEEQDDER